MVTSKPLTTREDDLARIYWALLDVFTVEQCARMIPRETLVYHLNTGKSVQWICQTLFGVDAETPGRVSGLAPRRPDDRKES